MVDYAGWEMPLRFGSEIGEHLAVRHDAGMFDVSHMGMVDIVGSQAKDFLRRLLANDIGKLHHRGSALYSCMLNDEGGILDDLMAFWLDDEHFRLVTNAATRNRDLVWIQGQSRGFDVEVTGRDDLAMIAVQGPNARAKADPYLPPALGQQLQRIGPLHSASGQGWVVARTGYTGEDGYEVMLPNGEALHLWWNLFRAQIKPCGLAARDTLRLEAGLNLYGQDMDDSVSPLECGLEWTVAFEPSARRFIGRDALERSRGSGIRRQRVGLVLLEPGILRKRQRVKFAWGEGIVTSGGYSPVLRRSIGLARVPTDRHGECQVEIRGHWKRAQVVKPPFIQDGKIMVETMTEKGGRHE